MPIIHSNPTIGSAEVNRTLTGVSIKASNVKQNEIEPDLFLVVSEQILRRISNPSDSRSYERKWTS